ncbi:iron-sulfur cluster assembly accessory protein [bacterium]|nr:iron-sulfur cluster assembly accessory protein [bacterium]
MSVDARDLLDNETPDINLDDITITPEAVGRLTTLGYTDVEFSVEGGGCSGMNYSLKALEREITHNDKVYHYEDMNLVVPFNSFIYLIGTQIDFSNDLLNGGFKFTNPQSNRTCGCGISFSV